MARWHFSESQRVVAITQRCLCLRFERTFTNTVLRSVGVVQKQTSLACLVETGCLGLGMTMEQSLHMHAKLHADSFVYIYYDLVWFALWFGFGFQFICLFFVGVGVFI